MNIEHLQKDEYGFYHPENESDVQNLIVFAKTNSLKVRVCGSQHSPHENIHTDTYLKGEKSIHENINLLLDRLDDVEFDDSNQQVLVGSGCCFSHMGKPNVRTPIPGHIPRNPLIPLLKDKGWALPVLGGVSFQTIGGFLCMGSAGGSLKYSLHDQVLGIRLIDGNGVCHEVSPGSNPDMFYASGVSMGLLGVITAVRLQCVDDFSVIGREVGTYFDECQLANLLVEKDLERFFRQEDYARFFWFPQPNVDHISFYYCSKSKDPNDPKQVPYQTVRPFGQWNGSVLLNYFTRWISDHFGHLFSTEEKTKTLTFREKFIINYFIPFCYGFFAPIKGPIADAFFHDAWDHAIPMDNELDEKYLPSNFMEFFFPIEKATEILSLLNDYFKQNGLTVSGIHATEIYASKSSEFWLHPAYGSDMIRVNFVTQDVDGVDPKAFYRQHWELLKPFGFRPHWGKYMFEDSAYVSEKYPRWNDFMTLRADLDPQDLFLTSYWKKILGCEPG